MYPNASTEARSCCCDRLDAKLWQAPLGLDLARHLGSVSMQQWTAGKTRIKKFAARHNSIFETVYLPWGRQNLT